MKFNINENVKVKLTDSGLGILKKQHDELREMVPSLGKFKEPKRDENGFSTFQLWCLMQTFGPSIGMGFDQPFETTIEIPQNDRHHLDETETIKGD